MNSISKALKERIELLIKTKIESIIISQDNHTPAIRALCETKNNKYFIKIGATRQTAQDLNREINIYKSISGSFMPALIAAEEHELEPILILEDLSSHHWPPPWDKDKINSAVKQIENMHNTTASIDEFEYIYGASLPNWQSVSADPSSFLSLMIINEKWLDKSLPILLDAQTNCSTKGTALCHYDLRSDNMCFLDNRAVFIDWNQACLSNPKLDLGFWLPSLTSENGPLPQEILPHSPEIAAYVSGYFASQAGLPGPTRVRAIQKKLLEKALPWVIYELGLDSI